VCVYARRNNSNGKLTLLHLFLDKIDALNSVLKVVSKGTELAKGDPMMGYDMITGILPFPVEQGLDRVVSLLKTLGVLLLK